MEVGSGIIVGVTPSSCLFGLILVWLFLVIDRMDVMLERLMALDTLSMILMLESLVLAHSMQREILHTTVKN